MVRKGKIEETGWKQLTELPYVGEKAAKLLWDHGFLTKADVMKSSGNELAKVVGPIGYKIVQRKSNKSNSRKVLDGLGLFIRFLKIRKNFKAGIYGPTNAGKTTLANRISLDFKGEIMGKVSCVPYETRVVTSKKDIIIKLPEEKVRIDLFDTPGFTSCIDPNKLQKYGLGKKEAKKRSTEALRGIIDAIKWMNKMSILLLVFDSSKRLDKQENLILLENAKLKGIPFLIVANKIDLKSVDAKRISKIRRHFAGMPVIGISAKKGTNMNIFYKEVVRTVKR